jgi:hypothetical protein
MALSAHGKSSGSCGETFRHKSNALAGSAVAEEGSPSEFLSHLLRTIQAADLLGWSVWPSQARRMGLCANSGEDTFVAGVSTGLYAGTELEYLWSHWKQRTPIVFPAWEYSPAANLLYGHCRD